MVNLEGRGWNELVNENIWFIIGRFRKKGWVFCF